MSYYCRQRVVNNQGNAAARQVMDEVFADDVIDWRGVGPVAQSVGHLREDYQAWDARRLVGQMEIATNCEQNEASSYCDEVLIGKRKPDQCPHFAKSCHPQQPKGALMVSTEGACAAYFKYKNNHQSSGPVSQQGEPDVAQ